MRTFKATFGSEYTVYKTGRHLGYRTFRRRAGGIVHGRGCWVCEIYDWWWDSLQQQLHQRGRPYRFKFPREHQRQPYPLDPRISRGRRR